MSYPCPPPPPPVPKNPPPRRSRRVVVALVVAALVVVGALSLIFVLPLIVPTSHSSGTPPGDSNTIEVLPSPGTSAGCIVGTPGVPRPTLNLDNGVFQANTYNVPTGTTGNIGMCYSGGAGTEFAYANWSHVGGAGGWFSYPQVTYGVNLWDGSHSTYTNQPANLVLPLPVSEVVGGSLWTTVNYTFHAPSLADVTGYDYSLDDFFTENNPPVYQPGNSDPFVEVMMWFDHHVTYPFEFSSFTMPTMINGSVVQEPWSVGYYCHGTDNSTNANVSFDFSMGGQSTSGIPEGSIGVNVSAVLSQVEARMPAVSCWTGPTGKFSQFYFDEANMGSEDGALGGTSYNYNWTVTAYCFHTGIITAAASTLDCGTPNPSAVPEPRSPLASANAPVAAATWAARRE